jgi:lipopolysaccharide/colanic/teichoic acid biosynthesis glycosyltransferase
VDVAIALLLLALLAPLMAVIALCVRLGSPGPVLFRQRRYGLGGRPFTCLKFRTMLYGAEVLRTALLPLNEADGPVFKIRRDPRVTRFGRWLRRSSLDELPQLWHVLRGEMSLVGPRPLDVAEVDLEDARQRKRLQVVPGLTCLWQIRGRRHNSFAEWMALDAYYVDRQSFALDLIIFCKTIPVVLRCIGAC